MATTTRASNRHPPDSVTLPPPNKRDDIDKTADWVLRNGSTTQDAETRLRTKSGSKNQFAFFNPADEYHRYYQWALEQFRSGAVGNQAAQAAQVAKPKGPPRPPEFLFSARMPNISAQDLDIMQTTARYAAKRGEDWLKILSQRHGNNFQFDFLRPNHSWNTYFKALIYQYRILLDEDKRVKDARMEELQRIVTDRLYIFDKARARGEYRQFQSKQKQQQEQKVEDDRIAYASIDWQDFSIVATVTFDELDEQIELPPPYRLNDLQSMSLEQKAKVSSDLRIEEAMPFDDTYYNATSGQPMPPPLTGPHPVGLPMAPPVQAPYPPPGYPQPAYPQQPAFAPPPPSVPQPNPYEEEQRVKEQRRTQQAEQDLLAQAASRGAPGGIRIRSDYSRPVAKPINVAMTLCPNCRKPFPAHELEEHIRIELLDPRWKEQRDKSEARYSTTNLSTVNVAENLKRFASQRDDVFDGVTGMPVSEEEQARRKRAALQYDGQPDPAKDAVRLQEMQSLTMQEQIKRIQEKHSKA